METGKDIHVQVTPTTSLDQTASQIESFCHTLAPDEQARAERFYFRRDCEYFIAARGMLISLLIFYLHKAPECLSFGYRPHGKPALAWESCGETVRFNLSHFHRVALYAVTRG
jgi:phosphopantetheinyl transferase